MATGILRIQAFAARQSSPVEGVTVTVSGDGFTATRLTDAEGNADDVTLTTPACALSLDENNTTQPPYAVCSLVASKPGYRTVRIQGVQVFPGQVTLAQTKLRAALVNEKSFAQISLNLELGKYIFMSNAEQNNDGRSKPSILSDALESLIAAIYLEAGFERAKSVALSLLETNFPHIDAAHLVKDYKTKLQEFTQSAMAQAPEYETLRAFGPDHKKQFEIALKLDGKEFARAVAGSKKEAQQRAAQITLEKLGVL